MPFKNVQQPPVLVSKVLIESWLAVATIRQRRKRKSIYAVFRDPVACAQTGQ